MKISEVLCSFRLRAAAALVFLTGCMSGPGFLKQDSDSELKNKESTVEVPMQINADGSLSATLNSGSAGSQSLQAPEGSAIAGSQITFQPGALAVDTTVTIEEGSSLASASIASELGMDSGTSMTQASSAVVISSSAAIDATQPFTISLVLDSGTKLTLADENLELVVVYKIKKIESGSGIFVGIIPNKELTIVDGKLIFKTRFFGSYQAAYVPVEALAKVVEKAAIAPIETKKAAEEKVVTTTSVQNSATGTGDVKNFSVDAKTATTMRLRWEQSAPVKQFIIAYAPMTGNAAVKERCVGGTQIKVNSSESVNSYILTNLTAFTGYVLRVCAVRLNDEVSIGQQMTQSTTDTLPVRPANFSAIPVSSRGLRLVWTPGSLATSGYAVVFNKGAPGQNVAQIATPTSCKDAANQIFLGNNFMPDGSGKFTTLLNEFSAETPVAMLLCSVNRDNVYSAGISAAAKTQSFAINCDNVGGSLDTACEVNSNKTPPRGSIVAGLGDLVIGSTGSVTTNTFLQADPRSGILEIDMKGKVELKYSSNQRGQISVTGAGFPMREGQGAGADGPYTTGGTYGGQGGFDAANRPAMFPPQYGDFRYPMERGSGGGAATTGGGAGGGSIIIRATTLLNSGIIQAGGGSSSMSDASSGSGGSIFIHVSRLAQSVAEYGFIKAPGGNAESGQSGGSGGRIAVYYDEANSDVSLIKMEAYGGPADGYKDGAAGTVYIEKRSGNSNVRELYIGSNNVLTPAATAAARTFVSLYPGGQMIKDLDLLMITGAVRAVVTQTVGYNLRKLHVTANAAIDHTGLGQPGIAAIVPSSPRNAVLSGYGGSGGGGAGFGAGGGGTYGPTTPSGGGAGGIGDTANNDAITAPVLPGTGGGIGGHHDGNIVSGGAGGGAIRIIASETVKIDGSIVSNGEMGSHRDGICGGGGGGGAIWITAGSYELGVSHDFSANGGAAEKNQCLSAFGGGGGGGTIFIDSKAPIVPSILTVPPVCHVDGGLGYVDGLDGSARFVDAPESHGDCSFVVEVMPL